MLKKALLWDEDRNQIEPRSGFFQFYVKTRKVCRCFASFSSEQKHFTHGMYIKALILPSDIKNRTDNVLWRNYAKDFRRNSAFAIVVAVTSRSSSLEYTMSVHAGAERNVCNTVVSTNTHQTTTNFAETMCKIDINSFVNSDDPNMLASSETTWSWSTWFPYYMWVCSN